MPELPEVETVRSRLAQVTTGKKIVQVKVLRSKSFRGNPERLVGATVTKIERKAKILLIKLSGPLDLLVHLKMTGQLIYKDQETKVGGGHPSSDWTNQLPGKHTRVIIYFEDGSQLYFNDMRVFGWLMVADDERVLQEFDKYGPDVNSDQFTAEYLHDRLSSRTIPIKQALLIGNIVGGIGNIYACEGLFEARIDPRRRSKDVSKQELERLVKVLKDVIARAIELGGTTFDGKYVDVHGLAGSYQEKLKVYGQEGKPCPKGCTGKVEKIKISGRGTYYCPECQV